ncbi:hypothetical protein SERLA73DRAFT_98195, partial [Serpula lacrymans var. lacrymans S7.3]
MRFYILGLGPIGSLLAYNLRAVLPRNHAITLIHKSKKQVKVARAEGGAISVEHKGVLRSQKGFEAEVFEPRSNLGMVMLPVTGEVSSDDETPTQEQKRGEPIEALFITTKAHATSVAIQRLLPRLSGSSTIVLLQNGMGVYEDLIQKVFRNPDERPHFILGSNTHGAWLKGFYNVVHAGVGEIDFGIAPDVRNRDYEATLSNESVPRENRELQLDDITHPNDPSYERYRSLRHTVAVLRSLDALNVKWKPISDVQVSMRRKVVVNSVINPLTAIMGCRNGELFKDDASTRILHHVCVEAAAAFEAQYKADTQTWLDTLGVEVDKSQVPLGRFPPALGRKRLMEEVLRVAQVTGGNISSMLSDVRKGRQTEVEFMNGYLLGLGTQYNVPMPTTTVLLNLVKMRGAIPIDQM